MIYLPRILMWNPFGRLSHLKAGCQKKGSEAGLGFACVGATGVSIGRHTGQRRGSFGGDRIEFGHEGQHGVGGYWTDTFGSHELVIAFIELLIALEMRFDVTFDSAFSFLEHGDHREDIFAQTLRLVPSVFSPA